MAANTIIEKINQEAEQDAANLLAQAREEADAVANQFDAETEKIAASIKEKSQSEIKEMHRRNELMLRLEARKHTLTVKRKLMDEVFEEAEEKLSQMNDNDWEKMIIRFVCNAVSSGDEKLQVPEKDREKYQNGLLRKINSEIEKKGMHGKLTLDDEPASFESGVMIVGVSYDINGDFKERVSEVRSVTEKEVANLLFEV